MIVCNLIIVLKIYVFHHVIQTRIVKGISTQYPEAVTIMVTMADAWKCVKVVMNVIRDSIVIFMECIAKSIVFQIKIAIMV